MATTRKRDPNWSSGVTGVGWYIPELNQALAHPAAPASTPAPYKGAQPSKDWSSGYLGTGWNLPQLNAITNPPKFDPYGDPSFAGGASAQVNLEGHAQDEHDYQIPRGMQQYGYDASGNLVGEGDANFNPYNAAQVLRRNYENSVRGTDNSYAAQGQLYAGSRLNAQDANTYNYGLGSDRLQRGAHDFYHGNDQTLQGVKDQGLFTLAQLLGPAFQAFLQSQRGY